MSTSASSSTKYSFPATAPWRAASPSPTSTTSPPPSRIASRSSSPKSTASPSTPNPSTKANTTLTTLIRIRELSQVFGPPPGSPLPACIARLAVLYEDLRIETLAVAETSMPVLDVTDERYRRNYFLRRSIATVVEFAETLRLLDGDVDFQTIRFGFNPEMAKSWAKALRFFAKHEALLQSVRNDIGGHFGQKAARYATANLASGVVGKIEAKYLRTVHLHFAGEIAATATMRHLSGSTNTRKFLYLLRVVKTSFRHATRCVHLIFFTYLYPRFGH